jgi:hypothetical protein
MTRETFGISLPWNWENWEIGNATKDFKESRASWYWHFLCNKRSRTIPCDKKGEYCPCWLALRDLDNNVISKYYWVIQNISPSLCAITTHNHTRVGIWAARTNILVLPPLNQHHWALNIVLYKSSSKISHGRGSRGWRSLPTWMQTEVPIQLFSVNQHYRRA